MRKNTIIHAAEKSGFYEKKKKGKSDDKLHDSGRFYISMTDKSWWPLVVGSRSHLYACMLNELPLYAK